MSTSKRRGAETPQHRLVSSLWIAVVLLGVLSAAPLANASEALPLGATDATVRVNVKGEALVTFKVGGTQHHLLLWGAVNGVPNPESGKQIQFSQDNSGGYGKYRQTGYWVMFTDECRPYDGPDLPYFVAGCKAPDGSYWALQAWKRRLPDLGFTPWAPYQSQIETDISHWTGELAKLDIGLHWTHDHTNVGIFGRVTYKGLGVHGSKVSSVGSPLDLYGRNVYIDTLDSAYGPGWMRDNAILAHTAGGTFCHSFRPTVPFPGYPSRKIAPSGAGKRYRISVLGPGVTPVVTWEGDGLALPWKDTAANRALETAARTLWDSFMRPDRVCSGER